jgi:hypothetical protein
MRWMPVAPLLALAVFATSSSAQVHRCKDATGKVTFSDQPCNVGQSGGIIQAKKSREEILEERMQAAEANERKYRAQSVDLERQVFEQQRDQSRASLSQPAPQNMAASHECKAARKELAFVSNIRTVPQDEKRMRTNAAITAVNASCGSNTQLMQEPAKIINHGRTCHRSGDTLNCF